MNFEESKMPMSHTQPRPRLLAQTRARLATLVVAAATLAPAWIGWAIAHADEYVPVVTGANPQPKTDPNPFILGAYGFIWAAVLIYVIALAKGLSRARAEIADLRRRVDAGAKSA